MYSPAVLESVCTPPTTLESGVLPNCLEWRLRVLPNGPGVCVYSNNYPGVWVYSTNYPGVSVYSPNCPGVWCTPQLPGVEAACTPQRTWSLRVLPKLPWRLGAPQLTEVETECTPQRTWSLWVLPQLPWSLVYSPTAWSGVCVYSPTALEPVAEMKKELHKRCPST